MRPYSYNSGSAGGNSYGNSGGSNARGGNSMSVGEFATGVAQGFGTAANEVGKAISSGMTYLGY